MNTRRRFIRRGALFALLFLSARLALSAGFTFTDSAFVGNANRTPAAAGEDITTSLAAYWSFDTATVSGASVTDLSGNGNTATLQASPTIVAGHRNEAVLLVAASSQYVNTANSTTMDTASNVTVACWVKFTTSPSGTPIVVGKLEDFKGYGLIAIGGAVYGIYGYAGGWNTTSVSNVLTLGVWTHLAYVLDSQSFASHFYVNGVDLTPAGGYGNQVGISTLGVTMGKHYTAGDFINGQLDEVRIYRRVLTPAQIAALVAL